MLEALKYINHQNDVIDFGKHGIYVNANDLHDYEWKVTSKNNRIASLSYGIQSRKLPIVIFCESESDGIAAKNRLMETMDKDVLALKPGKIVIGNYYYRCFVTKSQKKGYLESKRRLDVTLTLQSDTPYWVREVTASFIPVDNSSHEGAYLDYPFDFPYDFYSSLNNTELSNAHFVPASFRFVIYGPCQNPTINIADHQYTVNCTIAAGEYLTIDASEKTIMLTGINGAVTNKFNARNRESYIFEKIPVGKNAVTWNGSFSFDVTLLEERSEPKWT